MSNEVVVADQVGAIVPASSDVVDVGTHSEGPSIDGSSAEISPRVMASIPDYDREIFQSFAAAIDAPPEVLERAAKWYLNFLSENRANQDNIDQYDREAIRTEMSRLWGPEYHGNISLICGVVDALPIGVMEAIENARLDSGTHLLNSKTGLTWLLNMARRPPIAVPAGSNEQVEIEQMMRDRNSRYYRGADAQRIQARYRDLIENPAASSTLHAGSREREIAEIEETMKRSINEYFKHPTMSQRYAQLIAERET